MDACQPRCRVRDRAHAGLFLTNHDRSNQPAMPIHCYPTCRQHINMGKKTKQVAEEVAKTTPAPAAKEEKAKGAKGGKKK